MSPEIENTAFVVNLNNGNVNNNNQNNNNYVRAVSDCHHETNDAIDLASIYRGYLDCRRNKARTLSASEFEVEQEHQLIELLEEITHRAYAPMPAKAFVITKPDYREIFASAFRDRVVQHWMRLYLEPMLEESLIPSVFSCRKGKGTFAAQQYVAKMMHDISNGYTSDCWVMKLDLKAFYMSIDRQLVTDKAIRFVDDGNSTLSYLLGVMLGRAPENDCIRCGDTSLWQYLPQHKSLFTCGEGKGLTIGDVLIQHIANLLLNPIDHFITYVLGLGYARYVDDMVIVGADKEYMLSCIPLIRQKLANEVGLTLHPRKFYLQHYSKGVKFVGAVIKPWRTYVSNRTVNNAFGHLRGFNAIRSDRLRRRSVERLVASINSYLGIMRHHASYNIRQRLIAFIDTEWRKYIDIAGDYTKITIKKQYRRREQIRRLVKSKRI
jgi:hypothetical protein